jgi:hypothetical protein
LSKFVWFKLLVYICVNYKHLKVMENQQREFTDAEIQEKKSEMMAFFKEQVELLTAQKEYETLATEIEELRTRRIMAQMRQAQIIAPPPSEEEQEAAAAQTKSRTLKKEK